MLASSEFAPITTATLQFQFKDPLNSISLNSFSCVKKSSDCFVKFPSFQNYIYIFGKEKIEFQGIQIITIILISTAIFIFGLSTIKEFSNKNAQIFFFLLASSPFLLITTKQAHRPFSILPFLALFFFYSLKMNKINPSTKDFFIYSISIFMMMNIYPISVLLLPIYFLQTVLKLKQLKPEAIAILLAMIALLGIEANFMGLFNPHNWLNEIRFLGDHVSNNISSFKIIHMYLNAFTPMAYGISSFIYKSGARILLLIISGVATIQSSLFILGAFLLPKKYRYILLWYLLPLIFFLIIGAAPSRYYAVALPVYFFILVKGLQEIKFPAIKKWVKIMLLLFIVINLITSISVFVFSNATNTSYYHSDDNSILYKPTYSFLNDLKNSQIHELTGDKYVQMLWLKENNNSFPR